MSNEQIQSILSSHGITFKLSEGFILAYDEYYDTVNKVSFGNWVNVSGFSIKQIRDFLNY